MRFWFVALTTPQMLVGLVLFLAGLVVYQKSRTGTQERREPVTVELATPPALRTSSIQFVLSDARGLERPVFRDLAVPESVNQRYQAILAQLKSLSDPVWPKDLPVPVVFTETIDQETVVVLDFVFETPVALSVEEERQLLDSIQWTLERNGADAVRFLVNGRGDGTFLGHLSVPTTLD